MKRKTRNIGLIVFIITGLICLIVSLLSSCTDQSPKLSRLNFTSFTETIDESSRTLLKTIKNFEHIISTSDPDSPRIYFGDYPLLDIETKGSRPFGDIIYGGYRWYTEEGLVKAVRDSHNMLRASAYLGEIKDGAYKDVFQNVLPRINTRSTSLYLQQLNNFGSYKNAKPNNLQWISVYGKNFLRQNDQNTKIKTRSLRCGVRAKGISYELFFDSLIHTSPNIVSRGTAFQIENIVDVYYVTANHNLVKAEKDKEILIGSMSPQVIGYRDKKGQHVTLNFENVDLIEFKIDSAKTTIHFNVFEYHIRERTTRSSCYEPDDSLLREHPNLAVSKQLPASKILIFQTKSVWLTFPLWQPNGCMAALSITEHADYVGVAQDKHTMYGNGMGKEIKGEGILGNDLPMTKTIFISGSDRKISTKPAYSNYKINMARSSLLGNAQYRDLLKEFQKPKNGSEIAIHSVCNQSREEERTKKHSVCNLSAEEERTTKEMKRLFSMVKTKNINPVTWVDHGGLECVWESGWNPQSPNYIVPALHENNFKYINALGDKYDGRLNMIKDGEAGNLLFYVPRFDDQLNDDWNPFFFNTTPIGFTKENFTLTHLADIVDQKGFVNIHTYLPYEGLVVKKDETGKPNLSVSSWYNEMLQNIAHYRDRNELYVATTRDILDFVKYVRKVEHYPLEYSIHVSLPKTETDDQWVTFAVLSFADSALGSDHPAKPNFKGAKIKNTKTIGSALYYTVE